MRALLATDLSQSAETARQLVASLPWPAGSMLRVAMAVPRVTALLSERYDAAMAASIHGIAESLRREGVAPEEQVLRDGSAPEEICAEARRFRAELLVLGSRGHGQIAEMLLGSVAASVVDLAPCPVLVARRPHCRRIVFAEDGSDEAYEARRFLTSSGLFPGRMLRVVSVAHVPVSLLSGIAPAILAEARRAQDELVTDARVAHARLAAETAEQLRIQGLFAESCVRSGDPAREILAAARDLDADLIAMGSRGRTGLARAVVGSVARAVLTHASCSVLIARRPAARS